MNLDQQLREAVVKYVPEIMELEFGCEVEIDDMIGESQSILYTTDDEVCVQYYHPYSKKWLELIEYKKGFTKKNKILGRPITLADLLIALREKTKSDGDSLWSVNKYGEFMRADKELVYITFNLTKSVLDQSEEVKKALLELLK